MDLSYQIVKLNSKETLYYGGFKYRWQHEKENKDGTLVVYFLCGNKYTSDVLLLFVKTRISGHIEPLFLAAWQGCWVAFFLCDPDPFCAWNGVHGKFEGFASFPLSIG